MLLSFVIPCYCSADTIGTVVEEIERTVAQRPGYSYEIILVNDYSPDNTFEIIRNICSTNKNVVGINLTKNFGQHSALLAGYSYARGDIIISLDDDGQTPANELFKLVDAIEAGSDVVYARYQEKKHSFFRNLGSKINDMMANFLLGKRKGLYISSYFAAKRFVIEKITEYKNSYAYVIGLVLRTTDNISNVDVSHRARISGTSNYTFKKLVSLWVNGFTAFSVRPLRIATFCGAVFSVLGFIYGLYIFIRKLILPYVPAGYSSIMAAILFIGGVLMIMLGMIGEYIGRIYISINNSPQYVIRETLNNNDK